MESAESLFPHHAFKPVYKNTATHSKSFFRNQNKILCFSKQKLSSFLSPVTFYITLFFPNLHKLTWGGDNYQICNVNLIMSSNKPSERATPSCHAWMSPRFLPKSYLAIIHLPYPNSFIRWPATRNHSTNNGSLLSPSALK